MSVVNVPKIKAPLPNRNRNAFDLSQRHLFTAHAGMLLPVLSLDLLPDDHVEINASDFMRTLPMNTAAFASMRGVYEFFFVPYHQLWRIFDQFITGMSDYTSSALTFNNRHDAPNTTPYFKLDELYKFIATQDGSKVVDDLGFSRVTGAYRLLDLFGYSRLKDSNNKDITSYIPTYNLTNTVTASCNPFRILAYNKIYNDYYRNSTYERSDVNSFNLDSANPLLLSSSSVFDLLQLKYRNCQDDFFTNVRPSMLFSTPDISNLVYHNFGSDTRVELDSINSSVSIAPGQDENINVASIRAAFALDKLASTTMRAGKTFYEQMSAHYGVKIKEGRDGRVTYIGGFDSDLQVSDVTQVSGSSANSDAGLAGHLGKIAGKGTGSGSGRVVFDANEHGVLMCIYSLVPQLQYDCTRIDPMVRKISRFDYFTPEFENLGLQPLNAEDISTLVASPGKVIGYQPRYSEYKTALDINHGQFSNDDALSYWSVGRLRKSKGISKFGVSMLKLNPNMLDSIFPVNYNGNENTDCVFGGCNFNIVKVSSMSVDGLPHV